MAEKKAVNLRTVAERVGLAPCSVSAVLNHSPAAHAIPQRTKDRIVRAAAELNYRPNLSARSLRTKRTHLVAVISPDFGCALVARIVAAIERRLRRRGYMLILATFESASEWSNIAVELNQRGVEGIMSVGIGLPPEVDLPFVAVELGYSEHHQLLGEEMRAWLSDAGESAVEHILSMIERKSPPRQARMVVRLSDDHFGLPATDLGAATAVAASGD